MAQMVTAPCLLEPPAVFCTTTASRIDPRFSVDDPLFNSADPRLPLPSQLWGEPPSAESRDWYVF